MVQRYELEEDWSTGRKDIAENKEGSFVEYEDYAALRALLFRLADQVNLSELPDGLYDDLEKAGIL